MSTVRAWLILVVTLMFAASCHKRDTLFTSLPASSTHIGFENKLEKRPLFSILYYLYYYNGGGVSIGDINNDGLPDIYFTANSKGHNKLYLNKGNMEFEDITDSAGIQGLSDWCTGSTMADVNGDGLLDLYVSTVSQKYNLKGHNELYINNGNNTFTEESARYGLSTSCFTTQSAFFDYDHDGDLDCYILNQSHHPHSNVVDTSRRRVYDSLSGDRLYRNDLNAAAGKFVDVSKQAGISQSNLGYGLGIAVADMNNDGWDDIYVGNDFHENDYYYVNQGNGTFKENGAAHFGHYSRFSMGNDIADLNNDGQPDIVTVDMFPPNEELVKTYGSDENLDVYRVKLTKNGYQDQYSRNCLQLNNGNGVSFSDVALIAGMSATDWSWCPLFADFNNDGDKDLLITSGIVKRPVDLDYVKFISNLKAKGMDRTDKYDDDAIEAMPEGSSHPFFFQGSGALGMKDVSQDWGTADMKGFYNGAAYADLDNDGDLDVVINSLNAPAVVLKNNSAPANFLTINFRGDSLNTFGIGTKVYAFDSGRVQYQQLMLTRGFQSSSDARLHYGFGEHSADSLVIVWSDQKYQVVQNPGINKSITAKRAEATDTFLYDQHFPPIKPLLVDVSESIKLKWKHTENNFQDFNVEYLIPHAESTRGPKVAIGDVNNDGLQDMYVCGAAGQPGALVMQKKGGGFFPPDTSYFYRSSLSEDVDARFFDANGDGSLDLYVVSGGNEPPPGKLTYADRLYLNDGLGRFQLFENALPSILENKSCVAIADIDHDGDRDIFVGTLSNAVAYGLPQTSHLLVNDGAGHFTEEKGSKISLTNIGMVTSAAFQDLNQDGWPDLVVAGEWMPLKIFMNSKGYFTGQDIAHSSGLWQALSVTDVNGDGYPDILAGNWGRNSKLSSGKNGPLKLYVKDFDSNGSIDQLMCYTIDGKQYTFLLKDELERPLPVLRKAYLTYREVAGKDVQYLFYDLFKDYTELTAETLESACYLNDGKGNFTRIVLPDGLQLSPLMAFGKMGNELIAAGNFYGVMPYEGKYDAMFPTIFSFEKESKSFKINGVISQLRTEARDIKILEESGKPALVVIAGNNEPLHFFRKE